MAFRTVTTTAEGLSNGLDIYLDDVLLTSYEYTVATNQIVLAERAEVVTSVAGISPTINAINTFMRHTRGVFDPVPTIDTFRQIVRRTNNKLEIELGQGSDMWAAAEMDRDTLVITYFARPAVVLNWTRFVRWVDVQVEFLRLAGEA